jgi:hypothetical protein
MKSEFPGEEFILSSKGLGRTRGIESEEFIFVVGSREFKSNVFQAAFLSKSVERLLMSDNTITKFEVSSNEEFIESFEEIVRLLEGKSIHINANNCELLRRISKILDNEELLNKCVELVIGKESICVSNCVDRLIVKEEFGSEIEEEINFIAKHFYEVELCKMTDLHVETLEAIVSHRDLCLRDEESLLEFIRSIEVNFNPSLACSNLYGYVECRYLSVEGIVKFLQSIEETSMMNFGVWGSICRRLLCEICDRKLSEPRFLSVCNIPVRDSQGKYFGYVSGHEFEGILKSLTNACGGNVHGKGVVNITSSGDAGNKSFQVADHGWNSYWWSTNTPNSWICFDFKEKNIELEHYTLKSGGYGGDHLVTWEIEGSNDGLTWASVDKRNTQELNGNYIVKTFECCGESRSKLFRYIRLRQTGKNSTNYDNLSLCNIEFFGKLE